MIVDLFVIICGISIEAFDYFLICNRDGEWTLGICMALRVSDIWKALSLNIETCEINGAGKVCRSEMLAALACVTGCQSNSKSDSARVGRFYGNYSLRISRIMPS